MKLKNSLLTAAIIICASSAFAASNQPEDQPLTFDQSSESTTPITVTPPGEKVVPPENSNSHIVEGKSASGATQTTVIDQGGNLKMVPSANQAATTEPKTTAPASSTTEPAPMPPINNTDTGSK